MRWVQTVLFLLAFLLIETLLGGTRPVFNLPAYGLLALAGLSTLCLPWRGTAVARADCLAVTGLFIGWILVRAAWSPVSYLARADVSLALASLCVYLLTALVMVTPRQRLAVVMGLMMIAGAQTVVGGLQQFGGERFALFGLLEPEDYGRRASGLYICPNHLAGFLEVTTFLGLGVAGWSRRGVLIRTAALAGGAMSLFGLALTGSRGGYVSAACGLAVFAAGSLWVLWSAGGRRAWAGLAVAVVIGITVLAGLAVVYSRQGGVQVRVAKFQATDDWRLPLWQCAWEQSKLQPLTGTGSGTYQYYARFFRPSYVEADPVHAHNDYLQLLAEYGGLGLLGGVLFLGIHLWRGMQTLRRGREDYAASDGLPRSDSLALTLGALAAAAAIGVHSFVDFNLHVPANAMLLAFVFGLLAQPRPLAVDARAPADLRLTFGARLALGAAACWLAVAAVSTLPAEYQAERARLALRDERFGETIQRTRRGLDRDQRNPYLWLYRGQAHAAMAETNTSPASARLAFMAASEAFQRGRAIYPQDQWLLVGHGSALDGLARFEEADTVFREAIRWNPSSAAMHFHLATHLRLAGRHEESEAAYRHSLKLFYTPGAAHGLELLAKSREVRLSP